MSNYHQKIAQYAEQLHDQLYLLRSERGQHFAAFMGTTIEEATARIQWEISKLLNQ